MNEFNPVIFLILVSFAYDCSNQKDYCMESAGRKGGSFYSNAESACLSYLSYQESIRIGEERNQSISIYRILSEESFLSCVYKTIEKRKCEKKSEYIPHFGY
ncbi:hypothetical protein EHQ68_13835 [Leptospira congkakensis]|uniref:Uncharacterized protein n=1 Tax=Leptospira congkakensis TaxID=2484932 RepID=A0A4Z1A664_9LEPT|nr:hypothetical protein [Leptospira congkakensis]TGL86398.1 hypothetical protein EHQ68_13835 [Leptospira congkakensis]TGL94056.1 hypothetical protein EHQ69_06195 [Leptospira congkakensis]TGL94538.1 hypothetical protein EHQ70_14600 [Leptospira congkakensis]